MYCIHIFILIQLGLLDSDMSCLYMYISIQCETFDYMSIHVHMYTIYVLRCHIVLPFETLTSATVYH